MDSRATTPVRKVSFEECSDSELHMSPEQIEKAIKHKISTMGLMGALQWAQGLKGKMQAAKGSGAAKGGSLGKGPPRRTESGTTLELRRSVPMSLMDTKVKLEDPDEDERPPVRLRRQTSAEAMPVAEMPLSEGKRPKGQREAEDETEEPMQTKKTKTKQTTEPEEEHAASSKIEKMKRKRETEPEQEEEEAPGKIEKKKKKRETEPEAEDETSSKTAKKKGPCHAEEGGTPSKADKKKQGETCGHAGPRQ